VDTCFWDGKLGFAAAVPEVPEGWRWVVGDELVGSLRGFHGDEDDVVVGVIQLFLHTFVEFVDIEIHVLVITFFALFERFCEMVSGLPGDDPATEEVEPFF
jgi:hypothetical protein